MLSLLTSTSISVSHIIYSSLDGIEIVVWRTLGVIYSNKLSQTRCIILTTNVKIRCDKSVMQSERANNECCRRNPWMALLKIELVEKMREKEFFFFLNALDEFTECSISLIWSDFEKVLHILHRTTFSEQSLGWECVILPVFFFFFRIQYDSFHFIYVPFVISDQTFGSYRVRTHRVHRICTLHNESTHIILQNDNSFMNIHFRWTPMAK